jgi:ribosomal protein S9
MKASQSFFAAALLGLLAATGAHGAILRDSESHLRAHTGGQGKASTFTAGGSAGKSASASATTVMQAFQAKFGAQMVEMMRAMLAGKGPSPQDISKLMQGKMDIKDAMQRLDGRLPDDVASLIRLSSGDKGAAEKAKGRFDEESLQKARGILNNMIFTAWKELDDVIFECKEFQERNRGTFEQVTGDISRLGSQLASLGDRRVESSEGIMEQDRLRKEAEGQIQITTMQFDATRLVNDREMAIRRNDLAVFDMILMMTQCPASEEPEEEDVFVQVHAAGLRGQRANASSSSARMNQTLRVCQGHDGVHLEFPDAKMQAKIEHMMTPDARRALRLALGQVVARKKISFLEIGTEQVPASGPPNSTTPALPTPAIVTSPVSEEPNPSGQARKCVDGTPNCGLLHDLMSMEWGKFRDSFDELATEMKKNQDEYDKFMNNMNEQLNVINAMRTKHMESLAETISAINADTEEMNEKEEQKRDLEAEYDKHMAQFRAACTEILYTRICGVRTVRNQIMWDSTVSPPSKISDCDFTDWYPKDGNCIGVTGAVIQCDDTCPQPDPYACGGLETMIRDVVVAPNEYGMECPALERIKKCKQIKCPVDCVESEWSGWSKCTKECEGGIQVRTRSILTKAKNGGKACDTVQEEQPCHTGSCDRDCTLDDWTEWSPCSMACGGGLTARQKGVVIPIRGEGRCPRPRSRTRFEEIECNGHPCVGDEVCVAMQDLVMTIDGSGSLRESGFETVRNYAANLTNRYESYYYGKEDMKIGVVYFGNGHLTAQPDGTTTISEALYVQGLTSDLALVGQRIRDQTWLRGFTNMAQGLQQADNVLGQTGRASAQSAVLVISDGKFSMEFQTAEKARELKDKNVMLYLVAVTEVKGDDLKTFRRFASRPIESNFVRIPGLQALEYNPELFAGRIVAKFCPKAFSPSSQAQKEEEQEYMMIHEGGYPSDSCGTWTWYGRGHTLEECMAIALEENLLAFAFGKGRYMEGGC